MITKNCMKHHLSGLSGFLMQKRKDRRQKTITPQVSSDELEIMEMNKEQDKTVTTFTLVQHRKCDNCSMLNDTSSMSCRKCGLLFGTHFTLMKVCNKCDMLNDEDHLSCIACGQSFEEKGSL